MAISPNKQEELAIEIARIYGDAETRILEQITERLEKGIDQPGWREAKSSQISAVRAMLQKEINNVSGLSEKKLLEIIEKAYTSGIKSADNDIKYMVKRGLEGTNITVNADGSITSGFGRPNEQVILALAEETIGLLDKSNRFILRATEDKYREIVASNIGDVAIGSETRRQATQRMLNDFANNGITSFVSEPDKNGVRRSWDMYSYSEMATRSAIGNASLKGHMNRMQENGMDLVIVSDHPDECEVCRPWERRVLSISGKDNRYPSVAEARLSGLWHPHCGHTINAYVEGLTKDVETPESDPQGYKAREQQRYNERMIRQWKRREAVAMNEKELKKAKNKVRQWQAINREHISDHDNLSRKYERESIKRAR